ncbi:hypothetical protein J8273_3087 [Carpediemonas membranifera]|uniref:Uncharacterized protein n=1 Tax=Carpediemonas membranifera TaxID=201153 RepID=A0A8J6BZG5_9EUKA|nr:hypothetical protein J8273_3087 [Carpediemonas membranifera]|eukprot:KAG9395511.1 hypothetical protein J8273_3087 [Carpediemonas membranifera]
MFPGRLVIPDKDIFLVKVPANVVNTDVAIDRLEGIENIEQSFFDQDAELNFHIHQTDQYSNPMTTTSEPCDFLVLEFKRQKVRRTYADGRVAEFFRTIPSIHARCRKWANFDGMADFQWYSDTKPMRLFKEADLNDIEAFFSKAKEELDAEEASELRILPSKLANTAYPTNIVVRGVKRERRKPKQAAPEAAEDGNEPTEQAEQTEQPVSTADLPRNEKPGARIHYATLAADDPVPAENKEPLSFPKADTEVDEAFLNDLMYLMSQKPMWVFRNLEARLTTMIEARGGKYSGAQMRRLGPLCMYTFKKGPFRLSIRRGFDPRAEPAAAVLQTVDFRARAGPMRDLVALASTLTSNKKTDALLKLSESNMTLLQFNFVKNRAGVGSFQLIHQPLLQIADIAFIPAVRTIVEGFFARIKTASCDAVNGWFSEAEIKTMRRAVKGHLEGVAQALVAALEDPLIPVDVTLLGPLEDYADCPAAYEEAMGHSGAIQEALIDVEPAMADDYEVADLLTMMQEGLDLV